MVKVKARTWPCTEIGCDAMLHRPQDLGKHLKSVHGIAGRSPSAEYRRRKEAGKTNRAKGRARITKVVQERASAAAIARVARHVSTLPTLDEAIAALELKLESMKEVIETLKAMNR